MKNSIKSMLVCFIIMHANIFVAQSQNTFPSTGAAGIGTTTPDASSLLDVTSTTKGVLLPRMTKTQRDAIVAPATGLLIYQTNKTAGFYYYNGSGWTAVSSKNSSWLLAGNSGTTAGSDYIGTADNQPLVFKVYAQQAGKIDNTSANLFLGYLAGNNNTTGKGNTAIGQNALYINTTGSHLVAIGDSALYNQTVNGSGYYDNVAVGNKAMFFNTTGYSNEAVGIAALYSNTTGNSNSANGDYALYSNTTGFSNTASGRDALHSNVDGSSNTSVGDHTLYLNSGGFDNTAVGAQSLYTNSNGNENTAVGVSALHLNSTGSYNTAAGSLSLNFNTIGHDNTSCGYAALYTNSTGNYNTSIGDGSLFNNTTGSYNTATGYDALINNSTGNYNVAAGDYALLSNNASYNSAFGYSGLSANTTGTSNAATGYNALYQNTIGSSNTAMGSSALSANNTGSSNTGIGAGSSWVSVGASSLSNWTGLGASTGSLSSVSNSVEIGNTSVAHIYAEVTSITAYSDQRIKDNVKANVPGLAFITRLRPVTYNLNVHKQNEILYGGRKSQEDWEGKYDIEKMTMSGFIAQEVEQAAKDAGYDFSGVDKPSNENGLYGLRYTDFVMPLVKSVQELDSMNNLKDVKIESQQSEIDLLKNQVAEMKTQMQQFDQSLSQCCTSYKSSSGGSQSSDNDSPKLEQNIPNPFTGGTVIQFYIPQSAATSVVKIYSLDGTELKSFELNQKGYGEISVPANSLASGVYAYTLIVNGHAIDTKQMILTK